MLKELIPSMLAHIKANEAFLSHNSELIDIYDGNLLPYVDKILKESLHENYYKTIRTKVVPINILIRTIDKLAKVYSSDVIRTSTTNQDLVDWYVGKLSFNSKMITADEYSNLFRGYSLEPCLIDGDPKLRVLPFNCFLPFSMNQYDPTIADVIIKFVGKKLVVSKGMKTIRDVYHAYSDTEFMAFDSEGEIYHKSLEGNDGVNPYGVLPFTYGSRCENKLIPTIRTDVLQITKLIPAIFTDLVGCVQYQSFAIVYGVDIDMENCKIGPNAIWSLKSDLASQKAPQLGTIKPDTDIAEVINLIQTIFTMWLESMSIKVNSVGTTDAANFASGISKIIDEMDTIDARKKNIEFFQKEEADFWHKLSRMHNHWVRTGQLKNLPMFSDSFDINIEFATPTPFQSRIQLLQEIKEEMALGLMTKGQALRRLYPNKKTEDIELHEQELMEEKNGADRREAYTETDEVKAGVS